jgi:hypothetical protein
MLRLVAALTSLALLLASANAAAQSSAPPPHRARLEYERHHGAEACADEAFVREAVRARLGYDPFHDDASLDVQLDVSRVGRVLSARVRVVGVGTQRTGSRVIQGRPDQCDALLAAAALAISIAIDPLSIAREVSPAPSAAPSSPPASSSPPPADVASASPSPSPAPAPPAAAPQPTATPLVDAVGAGLSALVGLTPGVTGAATLAFSVRRGPLEASAELFAALPQSMQYGQCSVQAFPIGLELVPCYRWRILGFCGVASVAVVAGQGFGYAIPETAVRPAVGFGARATVEIPFGSRFGLRFRAEGQVLAIRPTFDVDGVSVWTTLGFASLGADALLHFR